MSGITLLTRNSPDITMDEQTSVAARVMATNPDGSPLDLTNGTVTWVADFHDVQQIKKDLPTMTVMLDPVPSSALTTIAAANQNNVKVAQVSGFSDAWGRTVPNFAAGDIVNITDTAGDSEVNTIDSINNLTITLVNPLSNTYTAAATITNIIQSFTFSLLPGDTMLPTTKTYGTPIIYQHMAIVTYPAGLSPGDIYQQPTTFVVLRGRIFISPILSIS